MPFLAPISGAVAGAITGLGSFIGGLGIFGKALVSIGLNLAVSALSRALSPKQKPISGVELDVQFGESEDRIVRCGRWGVAGHYVYPNTYGSANKYLQQVFAISDFRCTSLDKVWIDGEEATLGAADGDGYRTVTSGDYSGKIRLKFVDGTQAAAEASLVDNANPSTRWTAAHVGLGMCHIVARLEYDREKLAQTVQFFFEGKGAPLYDWRKDDTVGGVGAHRFDDPDTWEFSENPILMDYAYRRGFTVNGDLFCGMDMPASDLPIAAWTVAANICEETVSGGDRYRCAIGLNANAPHGDNIDALMKSCGGLVIHGIDGVWPIVGTDQATVATLTDDDLIVGERVQFRRLRPGNELVNSVSGTFPNPENQWSPAGYDRATDSAVVTADRRSKDVAINFETVPYARQAAQLAAIYFSENRFEATATIVVRPRWQVLEPGDWIVWNSARYGTRTWLVTDTNLVSLHRDKPRCVTLSLQERSGDIYTSVGTVTPPTVPLGPATPVHQSELLDFTATGVIGAGADGRVYPAIRLSWTAPFDPTISAIVLQWRVKDDPDAVTFERRMQAGQTVAFAAEGIVSATVYEVRHTLEADPPRTITPAAWIEVTTPDVPTGDVSVSLAQVQSDISTLLARHSTLIAELAESAEEIAANAAIVAGRHMERISAAVRTTNAQAVALLELTAAINDEETGLEALATAVLGVQTNVDNLAAGGLISFSASAGTGDVLVVIDILARATTGDDFAQSGLSIRVSSDGEGGFLRDVVIDTGRFIVTDGTDEALPMLFEAGALTLDVARIREAIAELFKTPSDKAKFGVLAVGVEGLEITT